MHTVSVLNFKGGVGKTTFTACLAQALALTGHRVLAIDNDHQHNLSLMLGHKPAKPSIRDVYLSTVGIGGRNLLEAVRETQIENLSVVTAPTDLCNEDVKDPQQLKKCMQYSRFADRYDYVLIDNGPGLDRIQQAALHASDIVFVPTELSHFAISGVYEMHTALHQRYREDCQITKIVPIFYRDTRQQNAYLAALEKLMPGKVTKTFIPYDSVFEGLVEQGKVLFLHRLASPAARSYLQALHELFGIDQSRIAIAVAEKRSERLKEEALQNLEKARVTMRNRRIGDVAGPIPAITIGAVPSADASSGQ
jgi:chromosome partitioning protein